MDMSEKSLVASVRNNSNLRLPPQSLEAEMALLGSIMLRSDALYEVIDIVKPESFYFDKHAVIFETMMELFGKHQPIDILSLSSRLKEKDFNTAQALAVLWTLAKDKEVKPEDKRATILDFDKVLGLGL